MTNMEKKGIDQKLNELKVNDFALKYCRILLYLTLFCCFLFTPVLAVDYVQAYDPGTFYGGTGTSADPYKILGTGTDHQFYVICPNAWNWCTEGGGWNDTPTYGGTHEGNPCHHYWIIYTMYNTGGHLILTHTTPEGGTIYLKFCPDMVCIEGEPTPTPVPTITFIQGPTMQPTRTINNTTWTVPTPVIVIPTIPLNISDFNCHCGDFTAYFNNTLIPEQLVQDYFDYIDTFFESVKSNVIELLSVILTPVNWFVNIVVEVDSSMSDALNLIQYALLPVAIFMQMIFNILPISIQSIILIVLTLDIIYVILHGRKE